MKNEIGKLENTADMRLLSIIAIGLILVFAPLLISDSKIRIFIFLLGALVLAAVYLVISGEMKKRINE